MEMILRGVILMFCCLQQVVTQTDDIISIAIREAVEMESARMISVRTLGVTTPRAAGIMPGSSVWYKAKFAKQSVPMMNEDLSSMGRMCARAIRTISNSTGSILATLRDPAIAESFNRQFQPYCYKTPICDPNQRYRNTDGTCNNLQVNPLLGAAFTSQQRFLPPAYRDGLELPRIRSVTGNLLPSARRVSSAVHNTGPFEFVSRRITPMLTHFGQFIDHDVISTPEMHGPGGETIGYCCSRPYEPECFSIPISPLDQRFGGDECMHFVRSDVAPSVFCDIGPRQQMNQRSSFIDGTAVYGWNKDKEDDLRSHIGGKLRVNEGYSEFPGQLPRGEPGCNDMGSPHCFDAGDHRHSETPTLTVLHIAFMRRHNRIAEQLLLAGLPNDDELLFQEAKRILIAELQHITYKEFLPLILNDNYMTTYGLKSRPVGFSNVYDPFFNPSTANSFGAAAYRFGHSLVRNIVRKIPGGADLLENHFDRPALIHNPAGAGCEHMARWMSSTGKARFDAFLENGLRNELFRGPRVSPTATDAMDLAALNIQRGRDHGLPGYNDFRRWCGRRRAFHFGTGLLGLSDHTLQAAASLNSVYRNVNDIDLFAGIMTETPLPGALVGPTLSCLLARQFFLYKVGDRFWYERDSPVTGFTVDQLQQIKRTSLAKIFCSTMDQTQIDQFQPFLLRRPRPGNPKLSCNDILRDTPLGIDLGPWAGITYTTGVDPIMFLSPLNPGLRGIISPARLSPSRQRRVPTILKASPLLQTTRSFRRTVVPVGPVTGFGRIMRTVVDGLRLENAVF